ncbi:MAG TPA: NifU family protein [Chitinophagales bacterium]
MVAHKQLLEKIEAALDESRPYLKNDEGDVEIVELTKDMVLKIRLVGACGTCPQNYITFKTGIETAIKQAVPEVTKIIPLNFFPENETL